MMPIRVLEPRVDVKADVEQNHVVLQGGLRVTQQLHTADTASASQALWSIYPPSPQTIVDRLVKVKFQIEMTTTNGNDIDWTANELAPRQFPLQSVLDVLTVQINGESISDNVSDKIHALLAYGNTAEDRNKSWSQTAAQPDQYPTYELLNPLGSGRQVAAKYGENVLETPRGGFYKVEEKAKSAIWEFTEPLILSPFYEGLGGQTEGFINVNQFNISLRFRDLTRMISSAIDLAGLTVTFVKKPEILITYITPDLTQGIPTLQTLPYHKSQDYVKRIEGGAKARGDNFEITSDTLRLSQIPRKMYIFAKERRDVADYKSTDTFARIKNVSILWNNQSGLLANASEQDLHEISLRNGCNISWTQWAQHRGSVLCIEFGKDIGLLDNEAPGVRRQHVIQIKTQFECLRDNWEGEVFTLMVMEGTFQISENVGRATLGNLTSEMVMASRGGIQMDYHHYQSLQGGGFLTSMKSFVNKLARGVQGAAKFAEHAAPAFVKQFPGLAPVAAALPVVGRIAGDVRHLTGGSVSGVSGGGMSGGRLRRGRRGRR